MITNDELNDAIGRNSVKYMNEGCLHALAAVHSMLAKGRDPKRVLEEGIGGFVLGSFYQLSSTYIVSLQLTKKFSIQEGVAEIHKLIDEIFTPERIKILQEDLDRILSEH